MDHSTNFIGITENEKVEINDMSALHFYKKWVKEGKHVHDNGYPDLGKNSLISIKNFFLRGLMQVVQITPRRLNS